MLKFWKTKPVSPADHSTAPAVDFCNILIGKSRETFGEKHVWNILCSAFEFREMPKRMAEGSLVLSDNTNVETLKAVIISIANETTKAFGSVFAESMLSGALLKLEERYPSETIGSSVMSLIPAGFLEERKIKFLSKEELEKQVSEKTAELRKVNDLLEDKVAERTRELEQLLAEQDRSAKLLVRRDLELTRANDKLRELDQRKSEFLSIVAHQLRTPLSGIKWTLSMIMNGELGSVSNEQKVFIMKSYESNDRMIELVESMLRADRIDSGRSDLQLASTQILDLIDNVLYEILPGALKKHIKVEFNHRDSDIPQLNIDQEKMRAVFQNLLDNAVKYCRSGGKVSISVERDGEFVRFAIRDTGIGIPEDQQALIFSRFFRARNALKVETEGNGLGLFIVKSIIEMHGGKIWFESEENEGCTFYFTLKI